MEDLIKETSDVTIKNGKWYRAPKQTDRPVWNFGGQTKEVENDASKQRDQSQSPTSLGHPIIEKPSTNKPCTITSSTPIPPCPLSTGDLLSPASPTSGNAEMNNEVKTEIKDEIIAEVELLSLASPTSGELLSPASPTSGELLSPASPTSGELHSPASPTSGELFSKASSTSKQQDQSSSPTSQSPTSHSISDSDLIQVYRVHGFDHLEIEVYASTMKIKSGKIELEQYLQRCGSLFFYQKLDLDMDIKKLRNDGKIYLAKTLRDVPFKNLLQLKDQIKSKPIPSDAIQATTIPSKY